MGMDTDEQQANDAETAGVIARPPFLFLAALVLGPIQHDGGGNDLG